MMVSISISSDGKSGVNISPKYADAQEMSLFNDHRRCLEILCGDDDEESRKLIEENLKNFKITFGKHRGETFKAVVLNHPTYVWWVCNKAKLSSPSMALFKKYCDMNPNEKKGIRSIMKVYTDKGFKNPPKEFLKHVDAREMFCRLCNSKVTVKETFHGDACSVCGQAL